MLFVPHGIIELPALWLGGAIAFRWLHTVWKAAYGDHTRPAVGWLLVEAHLTVALA